MTEEEKKAIERLWSSITDEMFCCLYSQEECDEDKRIVLKLIQKHQAELEKKNKMIDLMSDIIGRVHSEDKNFEFLVNYDIENRKEQIKRYCANQVEKE